MSPFGLLVCVIAGCKRLAYQRGWLKQVQIGVPVIVVGNISVGGTGKTPLVVYITQLLHQAGYQPGIICRGYKGKARRWPQMVKQDSDPAKVGDESVLLARQTTCPVIAGPDRVASAQTLLNQHSCDVIVSDDGFQHLKLARDIDVVVIDSKRGLGNQWCIPAGPLRESPLALKTADMLVEHQDQITIEDKGAAYQMVLQVGKVYMNNSGGKKLGDTKALKQGTLHAIAGIGHPERFFATLERLGFRFIKHVFPDHHTYQQSDLEFSEPYDIITTEKDALKLATQNAKQTVWVLPVQAVMQPNFDTDLFARLKQLNHG